MSVDLPSPVTRPSVTHARCLWRLATAAGGFAADMAGARR
jgi:hypothetical protein